MTYNLTVMLHRMQFNARAAALVAKGATVELRECTGRSKSQNRYLHLIIGAVAMHFGVTLEHCKEHYYKRHVNPDFFCVRKDDPYLGKVCYLRSSADLTIEEMSVSIDRFKRWAAEQGIYLPEPEDTERLKDLECEMGRMESYL